MSINLTLFITFLIWNLILFGIMGLDKWNSRREAGRVPESFFMVSAFLLGATGIWIGMYTFRHKTRKWRFFLIIPVFLVFNGILIYLWLYQ